MYVVVGRRFKVDVGVEDEGVNDPWRPKVKKVVQLGS